MSGFYTKKYTHSTYPQIISSSRSFYSKTFCTPNQQKISFACYNKSAFVLVNISSLATIWRANICNDKCDKVCFFQAQAWLLFLWYHSLQQTLRFHGTTYQDLPPWWLWWGLVSSWPLYLWLPPQTPCWRVHEVSPRYTGRFPVLPVMQFYWRYRKHIQNITRESLQRCPVTWPSTTIQVCAKEKKLSQLARILILL